MSKRPRSSRQQVFNTIRSVETASNLFGVCCLLYKMTTADPLWESSCGRNISLAPFFNWVVADHPPWLDASSDTRIPCYMKNV